jgi:hypothetical protein
MLLQEPDGSFVISPTMCVACRCGYQTGESIVSYLCKGDLKLLEEKTQLVRSFRGHSGNIQETFREHSGNIHGTFMEHSWNIQ